MLHFYMLVIDSKCSENIEKSFHNVCKMEHSFSVHITIKTFFMFKKQDI